MKIILTCLVFTTLIANAQDKRTILNYGIYKSASDFTSQHLTNGFANADAKHKLQDKVTHKVHITNNDAAVNYSYDSIWGFRRKSEDWRIYNYRIYKVVYVGKACVYIRPTKTDYTVPGLTRFETTYFSATLDSPVFQLTRDNLLAAFTNDSALTNKVNTLPVSALVTKKDKSSGLYQFITWL